MGALATRQFFDTNAGSFLPMSSARFEFGADAAAKVREWRARHASWQAIAAMFGCSEDKVRRQYDPAYVSPTAAPTPARAAAEAHKVRRVAPGGLQHELLKLLAMGAKGEPDLARALGCRRKDVEDCACGLISKSMIAPFGADALQLTAAGLCEVERLAELEARREPDGGAETPREARRRRILLAICDGFDTTCAIARRVGLSNATVNGVLGGLSAAGEVAGQSPGAGRKTCWTLTPRGCAALAKAEAFARG